MAEIDYERIYRKKYEQSPLEDIIVFRSGPMPESYIPGMDFDDNARALFEYALKKSFYKKYELVWLVKNPAEWNDKFSQYKNVSFISYDDAYSEKQDIRNEYFRVLCLAKYIFMTDTYGFALGARDDQIRVMLWHGCGFKARLGNASCADKYEYMTVTGEEYAETYAKAFGLRREQMLVTGYPRVDYIFHPVQEWKKALEIPEARKYIFWLPTFRNTATAGLERHNHTRPIGETGLPVVSSMQQLYSLNEILIQTNVVLLIKLHPFQNRALIHDMKEFSHIKLIEQTQLQRCDIHINQILGYADALISDYSSVAVDYLVLDRPVAFTLDDMETYGQERGFFWDDVRKWLPGKELNTFEEFYAFIVAVSAGNDPGRQKRCAIGTQMQKYHDDQNSARVFKAVGITL